MDEDEPGPKLRQKQKIIMSRKGFFAPLLENGDPTLSPSNSEAKWNVNSFGNIDAFEGGPTTTSNEYVSSWGDSSWQQEQSKTEQSEWENQLSIPSEETSSKQYNSKAFEPFDPFSDDQTEPEGEEQSNGSVEHRINQWSNFNHGSSSYPAGSSSNPIKVVERRKQRFMILGEKVEASEGLKVPRTKADASSLTQNLENLEIESDETASTAPASSQEWSDGTVSSDTTSRPSSLPENGRNYNVKYAQSASSDKLGTVKSISANCSSDGKHRHLELYGSEEYGAHVQDVDDDSVQCLEITKSTSFPEREQPLDYFLTKDAGGELGEEDENNGIFLNLQCTQDDSKKSEKRNYEPQSSLNFSKSSCAEDPVLAHRSVSDEDQGEDRENDTQLFGPVVADGETIKPFQITAPITGTGDPPRSFHVGIYHYTRGGARYLSTNCIHCQETKQNGFLYVDGIDPQNEPSNYPTENPSGRMLDREAVSDNGKLGLNLLKVARGNNENNSSPDNFSFVQATESTESSKSGAQSNNTSRSGIRGMESLLDAELELEDCESSEDCIETTLSDAQTKIISNSVQQNNRTENDGQAAKKRKPRSLAIHITESDPGSTVDHQSSSSTPRRVHDCTMESNQNTSKHTSDKVAPLGASFEEIQYLNDFLKIVGPDFDANELSLAEREDLQQEAQSAGIPFKVLNKILDQSAGIRQWDESSNYSDEGKSTRTKMTFGSRASRTTTNTTYSEYDSLSKISPLSEVGHGVDCGCGMKDGFWPELSKEVEDTVRDTFGSVLSADSMSVNSDEYQYSWDADMNK
jgi:hypothetical protein